MVFLGVLGVGQISLWLGLSDPNVVQTNGAHQLWSVCHGGCGEMRSSYFAVFRQATLHAFELFFHLGGWAIRKQERETACKHRAKDWTHSRLRVRAEYSQPPPHRYVNSRNITWIFVLRMIGHGLIRVLVSHWSPVATPSTHLPFLFLLKRYKQSNKPRQTYQPIPISQDQN